VITHAPPSRVTHTTTLREKREKLKFSLTISNKIQK
jgi:hypothetical protein